VSCIVGWLFYLCYNEPMSKRAKRMSTLPANLSYDCLLGDLRKQIEEGIENIRRYAERQKVLTYWNIGRSISGFLSIDHRGTSATQICERLSDDLAINERTLLQCVQFSRVYPKLNRALPLTWSHYRYLMTLENLLERKRWEERIIKGNLPALEFLNRLRESQHKNISDVPVTKEKDILRGSLYTYRIIKVDYVQDNPYGFMVDCGFEIHIVPPLAKGKIDNTVIVESRKDNDTYSLVLSRKSKEDIFTYKALVERVIDGDTLLANIDVGFGIWKRERLRLRGIDAGEIGTAQGNLAKRFLEKELSACSFVIVKTYKNDKYDRYLVDVFYEGETPEKGVSPQAVADSGAFLNAVLLSHGLAKAWQG